jgi:hypothetical protein
MTALATTDAPLPASFVMPVWVGYTSALLQDWLATQFTWNGTPLSHSIAAVTVRVGAGPHVLVWTGPAEPTAPLPAPGPPAAWRLDETVFSMWHPAWQDLTERWHLDGPWLHPETRYQIDPMRFADNTASLLVGCVDREDPARPRRYDPTLLPDTNDIGVIVFSLCPHRALDKLHDGYDADTAMLLCAGTAVVEAAVHEALETFQVHQGTPVLDPHDPNVQVDVRVRWHATTGVLLTDGTAT